VTTNQGPALTPAHIDALRVFLHARNDEADKDPYGPATHRAVASLFGMAYGALGYLSASIEHQDKTWPPGDDRRWWLLLEIVRRYQDHPDLPGIIRPFLDDPE
jgi:hypothetical protein